MWSSVLSVPNTFSMPAAYPKDDSAIHVAEKKIIKQQMLVIFVKVQYVLHIEKWFVCAENALKTRRKGPVQIFFPRILPGLDQSI